MAKFAPTYKQKCYKCKKNYVMVKGWRQQFPICYDCNKEALAKEITDPKMKEFFDIPEEFYKDNAFLRDIKVKYLEYGELTERQEEAFKSVVAKLKEKANEPQEEKPKEEPKIDEDAR